MSHTDIKIVTPHHDRESDYTNDYENEHNGLTWNLTSLKTILN